MNFAKVINPQAPSPLDLNRWLTAKRSTVIQSSELHRGLCVDSKETLELLFERMVG